MSASSNCSFVLVGKSLRWLMWMAVVNVVALQLFRLQPFDEVEMCIWVAARSRKSWIWPWQFQSIKCDPVMENPHSLHSMACCGKFICHTWNLTVTLTVMLQSLIAFPVRIFPCLHVVKFLDSRLNHSSYGPCILSGWRSPWMSVSQKVEIVMCIVVTVGVKSCMLNQMLSSCGWIMYNKWQVAFRAIWCTSWWCSGCEVGCQGSLWLLSEFVRVDNLCCENYVFC